MQVRITFPKANKQLNLISNNKTSHDASVKPPVQFANTTKRKHKSRLKTAMTTLSVGKTNNKSVSDSKSKSKSKSKEEAKGKCSTVNKQNAQAKDRYKEGKERIHKKSKSKSKSKSKTKIYRTSPINIKPDSKMYNTSPILQKSARVNSIKINNKNSPKQREDYKYAKGAMSHRDFQHAGHTASTKLNTQRTPIRNNLVQKDSKNKSKASKKGKTSKKQQIKKKYHSEDMSGKDKKKKKTKLNDGIQEMMSARNFDQMFKKNKKLAVPQINTQGPQRKQSYFDKQIYERLNLDNAQFFRRKKHIPHSSQSPTQISQFQHQHAGSTTQHLAPSPLISYRQYGTETSPTYMQQSHAYNISKKQVFNSSSVPQQQKQQQQQKSQNSQKYMTQYNNNNNNGMNLDKYRGYVMANDLQSFRKEQQLKWRVMCLQLTLLKQAGNRTPQKIDQIMQQLGNNISEFKTKCKQIEHEPFNSFQNNNPHQASESMNASITKSRRINNYVMESPSKIKSIMQKSRKSSCSSIIDILPHDNSWTAKNSSDKKLLKQLECMELNMQQGDAENQNISKKDSIKEQINGKNKQQVNQMGIKQLNNNFCMEFEKELQSYSQTNIQDPHKTGFMAIQIEHIPELEYSKSIMVVQQVEQRLLIQLCADMVQSSSILHQFLLYCKSVPFSQKIQNQSHPSISISCPSPIILIQQHPPTSPVAIPHAPISPIPKFPSISCSYTHSITLIQRLFSFLQENSALTELVLRRVSTPVGNSLKVSLQLLRNYFVDSEDQIYVQEDDNVQLVLDAMIIQMFQTNCGVYAQHQSRQQQQLNQQQHEQQQDDDDVTKSIQMQYFYNHCLYNSINQILNSFRPANPITPHHFRSPIPCSISKLFTKTLQNLTALLSIRMGYEPVYDQQIVYRTYQSSCQKMDHCIVKEEEQRWRKIQDDVFQEKYILAQGVIQWVISQEIMMLYNQFI